MQYAIHYDWTLRPQDFAEGDRVHIHPGTDACIRLGNRFGTVNITPGPGRRTVEMRLDSGRLILFSSSAIAKVI
jgi:hypothetical protein